MDGADLAGALRFRHRVSDLDCDTHRLARVLQAFIEIGGLRLPLGDRTRVRTLAGEHRAGQEELRERPGLSGSSRRVHARREMVVRVLEPTEGNQRRSQRIARFDLERVVTDVARGIERARERADRIGVGAELVLAHADTGKGRGQARLVSALLEQRRGGLQQLERRQQIAALEMTARLGVNRFGLDLPLAEGTRHRFHTIGRFERGVEPAFPHQVQDPRIERRRKHVQLGGARELKVAGGGAARHGAVVDARVLS